MPGVTHHTVTPAEAGQKLFQFLQRRLGKNLPKPLIMRWARSGQLRVDSRRAAPYDRLEAGQIVRVPPSEEPEARALTQPPRPLDIIYEDQDMLVIAKPAGLAVQQGHKLTDCVQDRLNALYKGAPFVPNIVHRLDKETSGLLVAGKTYAAVRRLCDLFAHREVRKRYLAWVLGSWPHEGQVTLEDSLVKTTHRTHLEMVHPGQTPGEGKIALAKATPLRRATAPDGQETNLLEVELLTGRTHQIRVQLASRGHPIVGDRKYGRPPHHTPMLLHAWRLTLPERTLTLEPAWPAGWGREA